MPQERDHPPLEIKNEGPRELQSARRVMARYIPGIPGPSFLNGNSDRSPILRGVYDLCGTAWMVMDAFEDLEGMTEKQGHALDALLQVLLDEKFGRPMSPMLHEIKESNDESHPA